MTAFNKKWFYVIAVAGLSSLIGLILVCCGIKSWIAYTRDAKFSREVCSLHGWGSLGLQSCTYQKEDREKRLQSIETHYPCVSVNVSVHGPGNPIKSLFYNQNTAEDTEYKCMWYECEYSDSIKEYVADLNVTRTFKCYVDGALAYAHVAPLKLGLVISSALFGGIGLLMFLVLLVIYLRDKMRRRDRGYL